MDCIEVAEGKLVNLYDYEVHGCPDEKDFRFNQGDKVCHDDFGICKVIATKAFYSTIGWEFSVILNSESFTFETRQSLYNPKYDGRAEYFAHLTKI